VLESTGKFTKAADAKKHIAGGARKVLISAPATGEDITIVLGVNENKYDPAAHSIISNASCTTNCLAPMVKVVRDSFGFRHASMTTIHSYTNDQQILDLPHKDLRRARAAAVSQIPTTTGAARATGLVIPEVKGKIDGMSVRVPTPDVSFTDLVVEVERATTIDAVNAAFRTAAEGPLTGVLAVSEEELVSVDYIGNQYSCTIDAKTTNVIDGTLVKVCGWYDNEWGYASRCVDLLRFIGARL
jgi:glyceraldehyde 3-phosphate dehydrogenase